MSKKVYIIYFSPTGSSKNIGKIISSEISASLDFSQEALNFTLPACRKKTLALDNEDILVCAFPVYSGRIPEPFSSWFSRLSGNGCAAIPVAVYGNRDFDDALLEASDLLKTSGCKVIAGIAAIAQHTFDPSIGAGRPDADDLTRLRKFATRIAEKIAAGNYIEPSIPGTRPFRTPKLPEISPLTNDKCNYCGICVKKCPPGIINPQDEHIIEKGCILCTACIKFCPEKAKSLPPPFLDAIREKLAKLACIRKSPELFI